MNSRERILCSLSHRSPDRIPVDFDATIVTGMHVTCVAALLEYFGIERRPVKIYAPNQMLGMLEDDLLKLLGVDTVAVSPPRTVFGFKNEKWKEWEFGGSLKVLVPEKFNTKVDAEGTTFIYPEGDTNVPPSGRMPHGGYYFDAIIRQKPIDDGNLNIEDNLEEFRTISDEELDYFDAETKKAFSSGRAVVATFGGTSLGNIANIPAPFLKDPKGIRDIEEWYISNVTRQDYIHAIFEKQTDIAIQNLEQLNRRIGTLVDIVFTCGTDFGTQINTFFSEETLKELYIPYYKKINDWIHSNTDWQIFKHCDGAIYKFIPAFIDAGFDILNPMQWSATDMDPKTIKSEFGNKIVFWGGGVDTQKTLPFGTPAQVREEVFRMCEILSESGGFVFSTIHNIQANTPAENIVAMIEAVREFDN